MKESNVVKKQYKKSHEKVYFINFLCDFFVIIQVEIVTFI